MTVYIFTSFPNKPDRTEKTELVAASIAKGEEELRKRYPDMKGVGNNHYLLNTTDGRSIDHKLLGKVRPWNVVE